MKTPARTYARARQLRWAMTAPERTLWAMLRKRQQALRFRKQHPVGPYVLDFYCPSARLCVEVDEPAHGEPAQIVRDAVRDAWLEAYRVRVLRFPAADVLERPAAVIASIVQTATPSVA
ncbi:MAG: endonuclease domain-containing protein [Devosia nanyangense]|uniref:Endonuclease domain-containing protein n=1 Tax=Devosia nanyangense TaxID=1228055 RepID=A0A933L079_9HYPH|nr:endonuclease domain-containing protein [Devosia nanyangense]